jgi:hypothetical protein
VNQKKERLGRDESILLQARELKHRAGYANIRASPKVFHPHF